jgi:O-methyltransferase involved in polyketide biosynthesis
MEAMMAARDYSTISPSAKALLLLKAQTTLPFARQAAEILFGAATVAQGATTDRAAELRRVHFELRARSLDDALHTLGATRVLEIAAGLSFRSLAMTAHESVVYVDTDLPELVSIKSDLVARLHPRPLAGSLRLQALDALDSDAFRRTVQQMPRGALAVVHEGLLMYLGDEEKSRLAASVREALLERGGAWITADVYVRSETHLLREESTEKFLVDHHVEENKFADWSAAEAYFTSNGFSIERRLAPSRDSWRVRETWTLRALP